MNFMQKLIPISILAVGASALTFQTTVLQPYHQELDAQFKEIEELESQDVKFYEFEEKALGAVTEVAHKLDLLLKLKAEALMIEKGL